MVESCNIQWEKDMNQVENQIKSVARESGANLVGIASKQRLYNAPPSGNPDYLITTNAIDYLFCSDAR